MKKPSPFAEASENCECTEFLLVWYVEDGNVRFSGECQLPAFSRYGMKAVSTFALVFQGLRRSVPLVTSR